MVGGVSEHRPDALNAARLSKMTKDLGLILVGFTAQCSESILARHDEEVYQVHTENQWRDGSRTCFDSTRQT